jgi:hypothetical protein
MTNGSAATLAALCLLTIKPTADGRSAHATNRFIQDNAQRETADDLFHTIL